MMIRRAPTLALLLTAALGLAGCEIIEGIFKVGFWVGVVLVAVVLLLIWLLVRAFR